MKRTRAALALLLVMADGWATGQDSWGKWQDDDGSNMYEFRPNHEFRYHGIKKVWIEYSGLAPNLVGNLPRVGRGRGEYSQQRVELSGAWETGEKVCSVSGPESGPIIGNLKLYVASVQCCMEAKRLGATLILRPVGNAKKAADEPDVCENRTLREARE